MRFGTDPTRSALDVDCKAHDLDNLYVVDTSFFPPPARVNPALTPMANALRVGGMPARTATALHGGATYGAAQVTLPPALEIGPPAIFWPKEEIAIDALHHAVYAAATRLAYELIERRNRHGAS